MPASIKARACSSRVIGIDFRILLVSLSILFNCACIIVPDSTDDTLHDWKKHVNSARALLKEKDFNKAKDEYAQAFAVLKKDDTVKIFEALTARELGLLYLEQGQDAKAEDEFRQASKIFSDQKRKDPDTYSVYTRNNFDTLFNLAKLEAKAGNLQDAIKDLKSALYVDESSELKEQCQQLLFELEEKTGAYKKQADYTHDQLGQVIKLSPSSGANALAALLVEVRSQCQRGEPELARSYLAAMLDLSKQRNDIESEAATSYELIKVYYEMGKLEKAEQLCQAKLTLCSKNAIYAGWQEAYWTELSQIYKRKGQEGLSEKFYGKAKQSAELDRAKTKVAYTLDTFACLDELDGRPGLAESELLKAAEILQGIPQASDLLGRIQIDLGRVLARQKRLEQAETILGQGLQTDDNPHNKFVAESVLAEINLQWGKTDKSLTCARSASDLAKLPTEQAAVHLLLARVLMDKKDYKQAAMENNAARAELKEAQRLMSKKAFDELQQNCRNQANEIEKQAATQKQLI